MKYSQSVFSDRYASAALMAALLLILRRGLPARALKAGISRTTS